MIFETASPRDHKLASYPVVQGIADWLCLAASPTFALMALLTAVSGGGPLDMLCSTAHGLLSGMVPMYLLMSAFHSAPWLKLISSQRSRLGAPDPVCAILNNDRPFLARKTFSRRLR